MYAAPKGTVAPTDSPPTLAQILPPSLPPSLPSSLPPSPLPERHAGSGMTCSDSSRYHPRQRRVINREWPILSWPRGFTFRHPLEDLTSQLRRVAKTIAVQLAVHPHAALPGTRRTR